MIKPKFEYGKYRVTRCCCTSGMCVICHACGDISKRIRVTQTADVSKEWANYVARNWARYDAKVEPPKNEFK